jgi:heterotetrameric sarcosine oxidase gamma subunit
VSEPARSSWRRQGAWYGILAAGRFGAQNGPAGVFVTPVEDRGVATVIGRGEDALDADFARAHALTPPRTPAVAVGAGCALVWAGPDQWLALADDRSFPTRLVEALGDNASVSDQSDGRAILHLRGPRLRDALAKGCPIDLHRDAFKPGDAAVTAIAEVGLHMWWLPGDDGLHVAVFRSMAGSFWSWLLACSAEFGCQVVIPEPPAV